MPEPTESPSNVSAVLMCNSPGVVPGVGSPSAQRDARPTAAAMELVATRIAATCPDAVVVVSPRAWRDERWWTLGAEGVIRGRFAAFDAPQVDVSLPASTASAAAIAAEASRRGLRCRVSPLGDTDPGALVPLFFLARAGYDHPAVILSFPTRLTTRDCHLMGESIAAAAEGRNQRWVVIASGDMSHRLDRGGPDVADRNVSHFNRAVLSAVARGEYLAATAIATHLRAAAEEDIVDSLQVAAAAVRWQATGHKIVSYDHPFGVGYLIAILCQEDSPADRTQA